MTQKRQAGRGWYLLLGLLVMLMLPACSSSKFISQATSRDDTIKFAYTQQKFLGAEHGVVTCHMQEDGTLDQCKRIDINFAD